MLREWHQNDVRVRRDKRGVRINIKINGWQRTVNFWFEGDSQRTVLFSINRDAFSPSGKEEFAQAIRTRINQGGNRPSGNM